MSLTRVILFCVFIVLNSFGEKEAKHISDEYGSNGIDGCKVNGKLYRVGQKWSILGSCVEYTCQKGGSYSGLTCASINIRPDSECFLTEMDLKQLYPKCCPQVVCPEK